MAWLIAMGGGDDVEIVAESRGHALCRSDSGHGWTVVEIDRDSGQVYSAMPGDLSDAYGGTRFARIGARGVGYVSSWYSESYARRIYRERVKAQSEYEEVAR